MPLMNIHIPMIHSSALSHIFKVSFLFPSSCGTYHTYLPLCNSRKLHICFPYYLYHNVVGPQPILSICTNITMTTKQKAFSLFRTNQFLTLGINTLYIHHPLISQFSSDLITIHLYASLIFLALNSILISRCAISLRIDVALGSLNHAFHCLSPFLLCSSTSLSDIKMIKRYIKKKTAPCNDLMRMLVMLKFVTVV